MTAGVGSMETRNYGPLTWSSTCSQKEHQTHQTVLDQSSYKGCVGLGTCSVEQTLLRHALVLSQRFAPGRIHYMIASRTN